MTPKPPFQASIRDYEDVIIDANGDVVFEAQYEKFGTAREGDDFLVKVLLALNIAFQE